MVGAGRYDLRAVDVKAARAESGGAEPGAAASGEGAALMVLAPRYVAPLLGARQLGASRASTSLDLGRSEVELALAPAGVVLPTGQILAWEVLEGIAGAMAGHLGGRCFVVRRGGVEEIQVFSEATGRRYSLVATDGAPTMLVSGVQMHRTKGIDPWADTLRKVKAAAPVVGRVLDTATGLGYTAIAAARTAGEVVTVELDPAALEVARLNPWSRRLFEDPKIRQLVGDSYDVVQTFADRRFDCIIHDPPLFSLAGQLYAGEFYRQLYRVLRPGGRVGHYIGNPDSASGQRVTKGVVRRLLEAGFKRVVRRPEAFGVVAYK